MILMMRFRKALKVLLNRVCSASCDSIDFFQTWPDPGVKLIPSRIENVRASSAATSQVIKKAQLVPNLTAKVLGYVSDDFKLNL